MAASKNPKVELHGKKVFLRPPRAGDFPEFAALMKVQRAEYRGFVTRQVKRKWFNDFVSCWQDRHARSFLICRQPDGAIVGSIGVFNIVHRNTKTAFTGYSIGARHVRLGYATEALQLALRFAFKQLKLHRIEASIQPHNAPSIALVKRAGFTCEGVARRFIKVGGRWRDHQRWAILADEWRGLRRN